MRAGASSGLFARGRTRRPRARALLWLAPGCVLLAAAGCTRGGPDATAIDTHADDSWSAHAAALALGEPRFESADLERGELLSLACQACHRLAPGEPALMGPNLHGVFGRRAASLSDFDYSEALRNSGIVWSPDTLDAWLKAPADYVPGSSMNFAGYFSAEDRRDLIAYLVLATSAESAEPP